MESTDNHDLLTEEEAAEYIRASVYYLQKARQCGEAKGRPAGPAYIRFGYRMIRYLKSDLDEWIADHRVVHERPAA